MLRNSKKQIKYTEMVNKLLDEIGEYVDRRN